MVRARERQSTLSFGRPVGRRCDDRARIVQHMDAATVGDLQGRYALLPLVTPRRGDRRVDARVVVLTVPLVRRHLEESRALAEDLREGRVDAASVAVASAAFRPSFHAARGADHLMAEQWTEATLRYVLAGGNVVRDVIMSDYVVIDVHDRSEFELGHIPGSAHVPTDRLHAGWVLSDIRLPVAVLGEGDADAEGAVVLLVEHGGDAVTISGGRRRGVLPASASSRTATDVKKDGRSSISRQLVDTHSRPRRRTPACVNRPVGAHSSDRPCPRIVPPKHSAVADLNEAITAAYATTCRSVRP